MCRYAWYHDIVPDERIVYAEAVHLGAQQLSLALVTLELVAQDRGTLLRSTNQMVSFVGPKMVADSKSGTRAALNNLAGLLSRPAARQ